MTKYNHWNYQDMGFNSEHEMNESIARVQRKLKMSSDELRREEIREGYARASNEFSFATMKEGARLEKLDRKVRDRILYEQEQERIKAKQEEMDKLMNALSDHVQADNEAKAQQEFEKQKAKVEEELQKEIFSKHNVKTDKQKEH